jgi:tetratricopeptide (TPR) repeat protein
LSAGASACAEFGVHPKCPAEGGSPWAQVDSAHFTVVSDLPKEQAESMARDLEEGLDALTQIAFEHTKKTVEHTTVVDFQSDSDFHAFLPKLVDGAFYRSLPNDPEGPRFVIVHGPLTRANRTTFLHELTHDLIERNFGRTPPWLNEGWAEYYSTLRVEADRVIVGDALPHLNFTDERNYTWLRDRSGTDVLAIPIEVVPPPSELTSMARAAFNRPTLATHPGVDEDLRSAALYAGAWALVHMIVDGPEAYQRRYRVFLERATAGDSLDVAFRAGFGDEPPAKFDRDFREYLYKQEIAVWQTRYDRPAQPFALTTRALTDSEVHLYWARLTPWQGAQADVARRDLEAAAAASPWSPEPHYYRGLFALARGDLSSASVELSDATKDAPDDPKFLLATVMLRVMEYRSSQSGDVKPIAAAVEKLMRVARTANELNGAADTLRLLSRLDESLKLAERAAKLAPYDPEVLDTLAATLYELGKLAEAIDVQEAAVSFLDERTKNSEIVDRLEIYRSKAP